MNLIDMSDKKILVVDFDSEELIWWTSQEDCQNIIDPNKPFPDYIMNQLTSRIGRNGRGRLWVPSECKTESVNWVDNSTTNKLKGMAGIVFKKEDFMYIRELPGIVTDTNLNQVKKNEEKEEN